MNLSTAGGRRLAVAAVAVGTAAVLAAGVATWQAQPPPDVGAAEVEQLVTATAPLPAGVPSTTPVPVTDGALPRTPVVVAPVRLQIPGLRLSATVDPVGVDRRTGELAVPPSVDRVGWYRHGPGLAAAGSVVIAGHVDGAGQGAGAFFRLGRLAPGARLSVTGSDGVTRGFLVVARERYAKTRLPLGRYFARDGSPRLTLITCGGPFDERTRRYRDNVVVTAKPL